jgi:hypothetical protein|tara:strand:+ start:380 stop:1111 length:732 start_codon:yes stop_codon:yes gene_type:complete
MGIDVLKALGTLVGMSMGGPGGAAIGAALGEGISSGGDFEKMLQAGVGTLVNTQAYGNLGLAANLLNSGTSSGGGGGGRQVAPPGGGQPGQPGQPMAANTRMLQGSGGITNLLNVAGLNNPQGLAMLDFLSEKNKPSATTPLQRRQMETGERLPDYRGTAAPDMRGQGLRSMNMGGMIEGPGTGTSDSIPAMIYQNGGPVQEARLSDGEFVMTADAVKGAGAGDRAAGAAKMYQMMNSFEGRA